MFGETDYRPEDSYAAVPLDEQLEALGTAVHAGKIRHVGLSNETAWGAMESCRLGAFLIRWAGVLPLPPFISEGQHYPVCSLIKQHSCACLPSIFLCPRFAWAASFVCMLSLVLSKGLHLPVCSNLWVSV